MFRWWRCWIW